MAPPFSLPPPPENPAIRETTEIRVSYRDTDQMGHVYYAQYFVWFERGRTEWLRSRGRAYREMERDGVYLPVAESWCEYLRPAFYDDLIHVVTWIAELRRVSLRFGYEILCPARGGERLARGFTRHGFVDANRRPAAPPEDWMRLLREGKAT